MQHYNFLITLFVILFLNILPVSAQSISTSRADDHAPIGVMGEHVHKKNEFMLSYRYMHMDMKNNLDGTNSLSSQEVLQNFMVTPTKMNMQMHMLGGMYAPTDWLTLMVMAPILDMSMIHLTRKGGEFKTQSIGIGDTKLTGLIRAYEIDNHQFILNAGINIPTGSINKNDTTPMGPNQKLPYSMQLGSGTVDLLPGLTYRSHNDYLSWGAQGIGTTRIGRNDNNYSFGDRFDSTAWIAVPIANELSASFRTAWATWGNINGADSDLNPKMVPTADPKRRGGQRVDLGFGLNTYVSGGFLKALRLSAEFLVPVYQDLDGPQLKNNESFICGAQYSF